MAAATSFPPVTPVMVWFTISFLFITTCSLDWWLTHLI
jgi:hypothetical protein